MRHLSRRTLARAAASGGIIVLLAAGFAPTAVAATPARQQVPCDTAALASVISGASSGDTLVLAAGCTYHVTRPLPEITTDLAIEGHGATLEAPGSEEDPGFDIMSVADVTLFIRNLNFTGGGGYYVCGGAISTSGNVTIDGGTFQLNGSASDSGGAICNGGQLTVRGVTFAYNYAEGYGGAIVNGGQLAVIASTFTGNHAVYNIGGAIANGGTLTVVSSSISNNRVQYGGGAIDNFGQATLRYDTLSGNSAAYAGAIDNYGTLTATATSITGNTASLAGAAGGIDNEGAGAVHLHRDTIQANTPVNCYNVPGCTG